MIWDSVVKGLHVRISAKGVRSYYLYYRTKTGTQRRPKIAAATVMTLAEARSRAREMLLRVANGEDPSAEKSDARGEMTVQNLFDATYKGHWSQSRFVKSGHAREVSNLYDRHIKKAFGPKAVSEMSVGNIKLWHAARVDTPYTANRALAVLSKMFTFAEEMEWRPLNSNPCSRVPGHKEHARGRYASDEEISAIGKLLEDRKETRPREVAFIYLLIFTGSRPSAIERATWQDVGFLGDDDRAVISVDGKTGRDLIVLPRQAATALRRLPTDTPTITGIKMPRKFWNEVRAAAGCPDLWARDWRRTFATTAMGLGHNASAIGELLNHKSTQTTARYAKLKDSAKRAAATNTADALERLLGS